LADVVSAAFAEELGDALAARIAGEATAVALTEASARAANDGAFAESLALVLDFVDAGVTALRK
jgi:hypothetical protein